MVTSLGLAVKGWPGWGDVEFIHRGQTIQPEPGKICSHIFLSSLNPKATHSLIPGLFILQGYGPCSGLRGLPRSQKSFPCIWKEAFFFELILVNFQCCTCVECTAFWFFSMSTNILFLSFDFFVLLGQCQLKRCTTSELWVMFAIWGKMRTTAREAASQIALRDCSKRAVGEGQYIRFGEGGVQHH